MKFMDHNLTINVIQIDQEFISMFYRDAKRADGLFGEVFEIVCDYDFAVARGSPNWNSRAQRATSQDMRS